MTATPPRRYGAHLGLTPAMEDYLKAIYRLSETADKVTSQALAARLGVSPASVTSMVKRLAELKLVVYARYRGVDLTESGRKVATEMIRHHRLLELYLTQALGFTYDEVHAEAERLEHFISEKLEQRIDEALGHPRFDPHGSPIPSVEGEIAAVQGGRLALQSEQIPLEVLAHLPAADTAATATLNELGLSPGATVQILGRPPGARMHLRVGSRELLLAPELSQLVLVRPLG